MLRRVSDAADAPPPGSDACILVVDDEESLRRLMARLLARDGFAVVDAASLPQAVALAESAKPALAIVDQTLPPDGGAAIVRALREVLPAVRVVAMSGGDLEPELRELVESIDGSFLRKPFPPRTLADMVRRVLAGESHPDGLR